MNSLCDAVIAHAKACRLALAEMRPRPEWTGGSLSGANLRGTDLSGANLSDTDLSGAELSGANLRGTDLSGTDLSGAELSDTNLRGTDLSGADLRGADLSDTDLSGAELSGANLSGADLSDTDLSVAIRATSGRFRSINSGRYDAWTAAAEGGRVLRFGCELRTVADWRTNLVDICAKHEPARVVEFTVEIGAILDYCDALDRLDAADQAWKGGAS